MSRTDEDAVIDAEIISTRVEMNRLLAAPTPDNLERVLLRVMELRMWVQMIPHHKQSKVQCLIDRTAERLRLSYLETNR